MGRSGSRGGARNRVLECLTRGVSCVPPDARTSVLTTPPPAWRAASVFAPPPGAAVWCATSGWGHWIAAPTIGAPGPTGGSPPCGRSGPTWAAGGGSSRATSTGPKAGWAADCYGAGAPRVPGRAHALVRRLRRACPHARTLVRPPVAHGTRWARRWPWRHGRRDRAGTSDPANSLGDPGALALAGLSRSARRACAEGLAASYSARCPDAAALAGRRVLVIDDVFTEGSTLREVARAMVRAGADEVAGLALARQPWQSSGSGRPGLSQARGVECRRGAGTDPPPYR